MDEIRLLIADDHPLFRKGIRLILDTVPDFIIAGEATSGQETVVAAEKLQPDVVLMDLRMPDGSGVVAAREILEKTPQTRILVVTLFEDDDSVFAALRAGARGYVLKDADEEEIVRAIRAVASGQAIFSSTVATRVLAYFTAQSQLETQLFPMLTEREREILHLLAQGHSNPVIARQLNLSTKTVANHVSNIFGKLQVEDRAGAIVRAREAGLS